MCGWIDSLRVMPSGRIFLKFLRSQNYQFVPSAFFSKDGPDILPPAARLCGTLY